MYSSQFRNPTSSHSQQQCQPPQTALCFRRTASLWLWLLRLSSRESLSYMYRSSIQSIYASVDKSAMHESVLSVCNWFGTQDIAPRRMLSAKRTRDLRVPATAATSESRTSFRMRHTVWSSLTKHTSSLPKQTTHEIMRSWFSRVLLLLAFGARTDFV